LCLIYLRCWWKEQHYRIDSASRQRLLRGGFGKSGLGWKCQLGPEVLDRRPDLQPELSVAWTTALARCAVRRSKPRHGVGQLLGEGSEVDAGQTVLHNPDKPDISFKSANMLDILQPAIYYLV